jgi:hypothetical protein
MTKPSDLFKKTGTGGSGSSKPSPFAPIPGLTPAGGEADAKEKLERQQQQAESMHSHKLERGKDPGKGAGKTLGGAGGAGGRPKV